MALEFFDANPNVQSITWTQYTPYWNDGDTCTFSAGTDYASFAFTAKDGKQLVQHGGIGDLFEAGEDADEYEYEGTRIEDHEKYEKEVAKLEKAVTKFLKSFDDDDLLEMFGDHQEVTINSLGKIKSTDYEHE
jgi:hypothetical protein